MPLSERGAALLEVLVAVAILATAGIAVLELSSASIRAMAEAQDREQVLGDEERLLAAHTLLGKRELDQRLGIREAGAYLVEIQRPEPALYRISVRRLEIPAVEDLVTVVYRPEESDAP